MRASAAALLLTLCLPASAHAAGYDLLFETTVSSKDLPAARLKDIKTKKWLGAYKTGKDSYELKPVTLEVTPSGDSVEIKVTADAKSPQTSSFLIAGPSLAAGPLTAFYPLRTQGYQVSGDQYSGQQPGDASSVMYYDPAYNFQPTEWHYALPPSLEYRVKFVLFDGNERTFFNDTNCALMLTLTDKTLQNNLMKGQILARNDADKLKDKERPLDFACGYTRGIMPMYPNIAWAGDLDKDKRLDFILNLPQKERLDSVLFLSSLADHKTSEVKPAATFSNSTLPEIIPYEQAP